MAHLTHIAAAGAVVSDIEGISPALIGCRVERMIDWPSSSGTVLELAGAVKPAFGAASAVEWSPWELSRPPLKWGINE